MSVIQLDEKNYATWRIQIKMNLMKECVFDHVTGLKAEPADDAAADVMENYKAGKERALAIIVLAISPKLLYLLNW